MATPNYWDYLSLDTLLGLQGGLERDETQLVPDELHFIITHHKTTMRLCDRLYGVTMNEPGVSKIVSVDIERAAASV